MEPWVYVTGADEIHDPLRRAAWLRRLARSLVSDEHLAEDLAQDVWVAELEQSGETSDGSDRRRAWLVGVARNLLPGRYSVQISRWSREEAEALPSGRPIDIVINGGETTRVVVPER